MKLIKKSFRSALSAHAFVFGIFCVVLAFVFVATSFVVTNAQTIGPSDSHVVSLYIDGQESVMPTRAETVKDFLAKQNVKLYENDLVEPGLSALITEDNFNIQVFRARPVTIIDGNSVLRVLTPQKGARLIAEKAGFTVYPEDLLTMTTADNFVQDAIVGTKLTITRATPVGLSLYGAPSAVYRTQAGTVGGFLKERGIVPDAGATVSPAESTPVSANQQIFISKFGKQVISAEEPVAYPVESTDDSSKYLGQVTVVQAGVKGVKQVVYELDLRDGQEVGRRVLQEVVTLQPQKQIQTVGTKTPDVSGDKTEWMRAAGIAESDFYFVDYIMTSETHWRTDAVSSNGCIGLGQNCPDGNGNYWLKDACPNWQNDPVCQLRRFSDYASRYGGWQGAYNAWVRQHWW